VQRTKRSRWRWNRDVGSFPASVGRGRELRVVSRHLSTSLDTPALRGFRSPPITLPTPLSYPSVYDGGHEATESNQGQRTPSESPKTRGGRRSRSAPAIATTDVSHCRGSHCAIWGGDGAEERWARGVARRVNGGSNGGVGMAFHVHARNGSRLGAVTRAPRRRGLDSMAMVGPPFVETYFHRSLRPSRRTQNRHSRPNAALTFHPTRTPRQLSVPYGTQSWSRGLSTLDDGWVRRRREPTSKIRLTRTGKGRTKPSSARGGGSAVYLRFRGPGRRTGCLGSRGLSAPPDLSAVICAVICDLPSRP
jgi:hypothetical protein